MARPKQASNNKSVYKCTGCEASIKTAFNAYLHPLLKVLICRSCHQSYGCGDFSLFNDPDVGPGVDECGDDNYCRWCVDGGNLFACGSAEKESPNRCHFAFCSDCISRNCPSDPVLNVDELNPDDKAKFKWLCYACDPSKLKKHRKEARDAIMALNQKDLKRTTNKTTSEKIPLVEQLQLKPRSPSPKIMPSSNGDSSYGTQMFAKSSLHRPRPLSKQLKLSDDSSKIRPSTKVPLNDIELKKKLKVYERIKQSCVNEISDKFQTIIEMFQSKDLENKTILKFQIEDIEKPIQEFNVMLRDLMSLYHSQA